MRYSNLLLTLVSLFPFLHHALANTCTAFVASPPHGYASITFTRTSSHSYIVSAGLSCPINGPSCPLNATGYVTEHSSLNITTSSASEIFNLISSSINFNFTDTLTGRVSNVTVDVHNGTKAYVAFTPYLMCTEGVLSGCGEEGDIRDGTAVLACTPRLIGQARDEEGFGLLDGALSTVRTDDVAGLSCNPASSRVAREGGFPGTNCTAIEEAESAGAARRSVEILLLVVGLSSVFAVVM